MVLYATLLGSEGTSWLVWRRRGRGRCAGTDTRSWMKLSLPFHGMIHDRFNVGSRIGHPELHDDFYSNRQMSKRVLGQMVGSHVGREEKRISVVVGSSVRLINRKIQSTYPSLRYLFLYPSSFFLSIFFLLFSVERRNQQDKQITEDTKQNSRVQNSEIKEIISTSSSERASANAMRYSSKQLSSRLPIFNTFLFLSSAFLSSPLQSRKKKLKLKIKK